MRIWLCVCVDKSPPVLATILNAGDDNTACLERDWWPTRDTDYTDNKTPRRTYYSRPTVEKEIHLSRINHSSDGTVNHIMTKTNDRRENNQWSNLPHHCNSSSSLFFPLLPFFFLSLRMRGRTPRRTAIADWLSANRSTFYGRRYKRDQESDQS